MMRMNLLTLVRHRGRCFLEEAAIENIDRPLFGVLRTPHANNIDIDSPLSLPIFADAIEEFKDLDIAYSRNAKEIRDSKRLVLLDSDRLLPTGGKVHNTITGFTKAREDLGLPDYVKNVYGDGQGISTRKSIRHCKQIPD